MCGRFALHNFHMDRVRGEYPDLPPRRWDDEEQFHPRYNVAPQTNIPVIMQQPNGQGQQDLVVQTMRWGLQARWLDPNTFSFKNPINARSETVLDGSAAIWKSVRGVKHCIIACEGYYEWQKKGTTKVPHYVKHPQGHLLLLAGFYEIVKGTNPPKTTYTCTILTTEPNSQLAFLHDRMPIILSGKQALRWLDVEKGWQPEVLKELRKPYEGTLICYEVPREVGKVGNEDPSFIEPLAARKDGLMAMMSRMGQKAKLEEKKPDLALKREPSEFVSDGSDIKEEELEPTLRLSSSKIVKEEPFVKSEREEIVLSDDSDIKEDTTRTKVEPESSPRVSPAKRRTPSKRASSPIEFNLVSSGSDDEEVGVDTRRKKRKSEVGPLPSGGRDRKPARPVRSPGKGMITDFFEKTWSF
ncbi:unnamed protein product [Rhizoctonia solani]|uniref:DUF159-domain-containing protein n=1 Tax=Rhizoctonia solani TaxID=456999 RepID=A0A8H3HFM2_9AGAM|nr:unnamed protein product [Rhizoctonia solani]